MCRKIIFITMDSVNRKTADLRPIQRVLHVLGLTQLDISNSTTLSLSIFFKISFSDINFPPEVRKVDRKTATQTKACIQLLNDGIFEYLEQIEDTSLIVVSNYDNDSPQNYALGLIAGHAYSVEDFEGMIYLINFPLVRGFIFSNTVLSSDQWNKNCKVTKSMGCW